MHRGREATVAAIAVLTLLGTACAHKHVAANTPQAQPVRSAADAPNTQAARPADASSPTAAPTVASRYPDQATQKRIDELLARIQDAYFDYDRHFLRPDAEKTLLADSSELAAILKQYPDYKLTVEGHADERGSAEYNMALGDARAKAAKEYLVTLGLPADQLNIVSYGKERPQCTEHSEDCWQKNRRAHIVAMAAVR